MIFSSANIKRFSHKFAPSRGGGKIKEDGRSFPHFLKLVYDGQLAVMYFLFSSLVSLLLQLLGNETNKSMRWNEIRCSGWRAGRVEGRKERRMYM